MENNIHLYIMPAKVRNKTKRRVKHRSRRHKTRRSKTSKHKVSQRKANKRKSRNKNQLIIDNRYRVIKLLHKSKYRGGNPSGYLGYAVEALRSFCGYGDKFPENYKEIALLGKGGSR